MNRRQLCERLEDRRLLAGDLSCELDLQISLTSESVEVSPGDLVEFELTLTNVGETDAVTAIVASSIDPGIEQLNWHREGTSERHAGNVNDRPVVGAGETISYFVEGVAARDILGAINSTATVTPAPGQTDVDLSNNSSSFAHSAPLRTQQPEYVGSLPKCFDAAHTVGDRLFFIGTPEADGEPCYSSRAYASSGPWGGASQSDRWHAGRYSDGERHSYLRRTRSA